MEMRENQLYRPLVETDDPEGGRPPKNYAPSGGLDDDCCGGCCDNRCCDVFKKVVCCCGLCGKMGPILEKVFCCCGRCYRLPCCPPLKRCGRWTKEKAGRLKDFLFQSSSVCHAAWLFFFLFLVLLFAILMATLLSKVDDPYN